MAESPYVQVEDVPSGPRPIYQIAREIRREWPTVTPKADIYLRAMDQLRRIDDMCGLEYGDMVVAHFLSQCQGWRGPIARRIKKELQDQILAYNKRKH